MGVRNAVLGTLAILSAVLLAMPSPPVLAQEGGDRAGVSAAVYGNVQLSRVSADIVGRRVASGEDILLGDAIRSEPDSGMQVLLLDQTVFTIGPASEITVDTFVYDPSDGSGEVSVSIAKGAFRFATGLIAQGEPENMTVKLPHGTIGIRGTIVAGRVGTETSEVILLGPGDEASTNERVGRIEVSNAAGSVSISRSGYATTVGQNAPPAPPYPAPAGSIDGLLSAVSGEGDPAGEEDTGEDSGTESDGTATESDTDGTDGSTDSGDTETEITSTEDTSLQLTGSIDGESVTTLASTTTVETESELNTTSSTQETQSETESASSTTEVVANTLGELTTLQDLQTVTGGVGVITGKFPLISVDASGEFAFKGSIDFGAQTVAFDLAADWTTAAFANDGLGVGTDVLFSIGPDLYSEVFESSDVIDLFADNDPFDSTNNAPDEIFENLGPNEAMKIFIRLRNGETDVARFLDVDVRIDDDGLLVHSDGIVTGTR